MSNMWMGWIQHCLLVLLSSVVCSQAGSRQYCHNEVFNAECGPDEVIMVQSALYGRMQLGRCVKTDFGFVGCYTDVLDVTERRCSGRRTCEIRIPDAMFDDTRPCNEDLKSYFEINYICMKVITADPTKCRGSNHLKITGSAGYLSSTVTKETSCGSEVSPWVIEGQPGQKVNLSLLDFTPLIDQSRGMDAIKCLKYATLKDGASERHIDICGGIQREAQIYTSLTNFIEVKVNSPGNYHFLLKYEVIGCPDVRAPEHTKITRQDDKLTISCPTTGDRWHLVCRGATWYGKTGNCSQEVKEDVEDYVFGDLSFPVGISILIIIVVALAIGGTILVFGLVALKRRATGRSISNTQTPSRIRCKDNIALTMKVAQSYPECKEVHSPRPASVAAFGYHTDSPSRRDEHPAESDYAYVWDPDSTSCATECKDRNVPRYDATFPRTIVASGPTDSGTLRGVSGRYSYKHPERTPQYFELDPDVVAHGGILVATSGGQTIAADKSHCFVPSCTECDKTVLDNIRNFQHSNTQPACI